MRNMINKRLHQRVLLQQSGQLGLIEEAILETTPALLYRTTLTNLSFGGLKLLVIPALQGELLSKLSQGTVNLYLEFMLPPSTRNLQTTLKFKWAQTKRLGETTAMVIGTEFITRTQELLREIDTHFRAVTPSSVLYKERRFFPRVPVDLALQFTIQGIKKFGWFQQIYGARAVNLSAAGIRFRPLEPLKRKVLNQLQTDSRLLVTRFHIPHLNQTFQVAGRPVTMKREPGPEQAAGGRPEFGLKFLNISEQNQGRLIEYLALKRQHFLKQELEEA